MAVIYLYNSNQTDFRYNGKPLPTAYDVIVSNSLNGEYYVTGKHPLDKKETYKAILEDKIVKVHTMDGMQPFRIVSVSKHELYIEFEAWPLFYADMRNKLVKPININDGTGQAVLNRFRNNLLINPPFSFYSNITDFYDYYTQDESERESNPNQLYNALDVFKDIVATWGGEVWIRGYEVRLNERIGSDTESLLYEKKNITEFVDTTSLKSLVTRVHGRSEWQEDIEVLVPPENGEENDDNYKPRYRTEKENHSITTTVDSPLIGAYGGVVFEQQFTNNDLRTKEELEEWLQKKFDIENIDKPQRTIEVGTDLIDGTRVTLGDALVLKYTKHDVDMRIKVIGYEYDGFANKTTKIILGQPKQSSSSTIGNTIVDLIDDAVKEIDKEIVKVQTSANGKNKNFYGTADPNTLDLDAQEGDTYFRDLGDEMQIWIFNGTMWDLVMDTSDTTKNAREIEEKQKLIDEAKERADEAVNQINEAIASAGFSSLAELTESLGGRTSALDVKVDGITGIVTDYDERISTVEQTAVGLQTTVDSKASQSQVTQLSTLVNSKVSNSDFTSQIGQLSNAINLRVTSTELNNAVSGKADKDRLITQINLSPDTALIQSENILLDGDVTVRGTAWMDGAVLKDLSVDGAKITDATIGSAKIAYLDVAKINGNITNFIQSYWNDAVGGGVSISAATGVRTRATSNEESRLEDGGIKFYDRYGSYVGKLDSSYSNEGAGGVSLFVRGNGHFSLIEELGTLTNPIYNPVLYFHNQSSNIYTNRDFNFKGNRIFDIQSMRFSGGNAAVRRQASNNVEITTHGEDNTAVLFGQTTAQFYRGIDMNGRNITNQSDIRLKTNVEKSHINALKEIERLEFIEYEWDKSKGAINEGKPEERQFGLIAQYTPFLQTKAGESESYLSVDLTKQINLNSKATQELLHYTRLLEERIEVLENGA